MPGKSNLSAIPRLWNKDAILIARINQDIERIAGSMKLLSRGIAAYICGNRNGWRMVICDNNKKK